MNEHVCDQTTNDTDMHSTITNTSSKGEDDEDGLDRKNETVIADGSDT